MGKSTSKLGCALSIFRCLGQKKKRTHDKSRYDETSTPSQSNISTQHNGQRVRFQMSQTVSECPLTPLSAKSDTMSICSDKSGRSSVYLDALEDHLDNISNEGDSDYLDDAFSSALQIDGQFFFSARGDAHAYEGIKQYPPIPTTKPDGLNKHPISCSDMQTLLYKYQHSDIDNEEEKKEVDMQCFVGEALEHQARVLMGVTKDDNTKVFESTNLLLDELKMPQIKIRERGYPGELTEDELEAVKLFKMELQSRDPIYYEIVRSFASVEKEAYALCRFLRARKFQVEKVFELLNDAKDGFMVAKKNNFYPDLEEALGFSKSVFLSQYPAVFSGNAKNGCPVMYLRAGQIQPEGVKCLVSIDNVDQYFWNDILYTLCPLIGEGRKMNPNLVRCENFNIYDLKGLSRAQITSDTFEMIKVGNQVMTSFPETLHCLLIINAPSWFGLIWSVVKKLIDPRTASKIEVFTNNKSGIARMNEFIDVTQIPSDYGGAGPSLAESAGKSFGDDKRQELIILNHLFQLTKKQKTQMYEFTVEKGNPIVLKLYTRCSAGATVELYKGGSDRAVIAVKVSGDEDDDDGKPYSRLIGTCVGPGKYTVKLSGKVPGSFLVLGIMDA